MLTHKLLKIINWSDACYNGNSSGVQWGLSRKLSGVEGRFHRRSGIWTESWKISGSLAGDKRSKNKVVEAWNSQHSVFVELYLSLWLEGSIFTYEHLCVTEKGVGGWGWTVNYKTDKYALLCARHSSKTFLDIATSAVPSTLSGGYYYYCPQFTREETEEQRLRILPQVAQLVSDRAPGPVL